MLNFIFRITGAVGKGIAALTFDKEFQKKRRDNLNRRPANFQEGLARGGKGLVMVSHRYIFFSMFKVTLFYRRVFLME